MTRTKKPRIIKQPNPPRCLPLLNLEIRLDKNTIIKADKIERCLVSRRLMGNRPAETAPMFMLENAVIVTSREGQIIGVETFASYGLWKELIAEAS
ncbi:MAG: hypothetical protein ABR909_04960 [Candidatus Bathyarchaeia archaeon]